MTNKTRKNYKKVHRGGRMVPLQNNSNTHIHLVDQNNYDSNSNNNNSNNANYYPEASAENMMNAANNAQYERNIRTSTLRPILDNAEEALRQFVERPSINTMMDVIEVTDRFIVTIRPLVYNEVNVYYRDFLLSMLYEAIEAANNTGLNANASNAMSRLDEKINELKTVFSVGGRRRMTRSRKAYTRKAYKKTQHRKRRGMTIHRRRYQRR
jgi:hypothetical protein